MQMLKIILVSNYSCVHKLTYLIKQRMNSTFEFRYGFDSKLHRLIDVVIGKGDQCMALGRFGRAMSYPDEACYLLDYYGDNMVITNLSISDPEGKFIECQEEEPRRYNIFSLKTGEYRRNIHCNNHLD